MGKTDLSHYHGRTALDCQLLEIYRLARIPIGIDASHMLALVNGIPIAKIAPTDEEGEQGCSYRNLPPSRLSHGPYAYYTRKRPA